MKKILKNFINSTTLQDISGVLRGLDRVQFGIYKQYQFKRTGFYEMPLNISPDGKSSVFTKIESESHDLEFYDYNPSVDNQAQIISREEVKPAHEKVSVRGQKVETTFNITKSGTNSKGQPIRIVNASNFKQTNIYTEKFSNKNTQDKQNITNEPIQIRLEGDYQQDFLKGESKIGSERKVPASSYSRAFHFGKLGVGLLTGALGHAVKQTFGYNEQYNKNNQEQASSFFERHMLTKENADKLSQALCRMRGAPMKLGQLLSMQEEGLIPKPIREAFEKARQSADIMPKKQLHQLLSQEWGNDWQLKFQQFQDNPIAAASIGQVHKAILKDGREVALKIQYPGVASSIDSDLNNLKFLLEYTSIFPKKLYLDQIIKVCRDELKEECDYILEATKQKRFFNLAKNQKGFCVPQIIDELTTPRILTQEFVTGLSMEQCENLSQEQRDKLGEKFMRITLQELFEFRYMQTDPNPANFFYNPTKDILYLLDFGAAREFPKRFVSLYFQIVYGAATNNPQLCLQASQELGLLSGEENRQMIEAHVQSIIIVGEPFSTTGPFDFGNQILTEKIYKYFPVMIQNRLVPPPQEVYSLHRKLSGAYLMNMKLKSKVNCRKILNDIHLKVHKELDVPLYNY